MIRSGHNWGCESQGWCGSEIQAETVRYPDTCKAPKNYEFSKTSFWPQGIYISSENSRRDGISREK